MLENFFSFVCEKRAGFNGCGVKLQEKNGKGGKKVK
jgi:hypothetical protein